MFERWTNSWLEIIQWRCLWIEFHGDITRIFTWFTAFITFWWFWANTEQNGKDDSMREREMDMEWKRSNVQLTIDKLIYSCVVVCAMCVMNFTAVQDSKTVQTELILSLSLPFPLSALIMYSLYSPVNWTTPDSYTYFAVFMVILCNVRLWGMN